MSIFFMDKFMSVFEKTFREKGISLTSSRLALFSVLEKARGHLTVDEILSRARKKDRTLGLATVYRTLNLLCALGLIEKHEFPNMEATYERVSETEHHHHHIIDVRSGAITEFSADELDVVLEKIATAYGYKMQGHKIEIYGEKIILDEASPKGRV